MLTGAIQVCRVDIFLAAAAMLTGATQALCVTGRLTKELCKHMCCADNQACHGTPWCPFCLIPCVDRGCKCAGLSTALASHIFN